MKMREKTITAVCRTLDGIEWTSWKVKPDETERVQQDVATADFSGDTTEEIISSIELPENVTDHLTGDITVSLRTSELLMRIMELPAVEESEITDMVGFQIDKISPFPQEQLAISHEVLQQNEETSLVLMVAAKRSCIDAIGDTFEEKGIRVHSIDARALGWVKLLEDEGHVAGKGCEIFIIDDGIDFSLVIFADGIPAAFRILDAKPGDAETVGELAAEIGYTLTALDTERSLSAPDSIELWSYGEVSASIRAELSEKSGLPAYQHQLASLPPLSEGISRRKLNGGSRVELIPREWVEHENRKQLRRKFTLISSAIAAVWIMVLLVFFSIYKVRDVRLNKVKDRLAAIEPSGKQALQNREKLKTLKVYTDRSDSALECLREVTQLLPPGNIEFVSYNYKKGKGVTLRGTAGSDSIVHNFFETLTDSTLFEQIKNESVTAKTIKGVRGAVFSVSLELPAEEDAK
ncbi:MAG: PilN domain-containing protein [Verrucomicrobiota bacterium]